MHKVDVIKEKLRKGIKPNPDQMGYLIANDRHAFFNWMLDNNLIDVNKALRVQLGNDFLPFTPNRKKMEGVIDSYIRSGNTEALQTIINEFDYDPAKGNYTTDQNLINAINLYRKA